jgi:sporulation protein YlmC with PRC-barrel domain
MAGPWNVAATGCASSKTHERNSTMKKHLLATTAAIALFASPVAFAQDTTNTGGNSSVFTTEPYENPAPVDGFYAADPSQILATRFIGANIYNGAGEEDKTVGDVNDIIMTPDGRAVAVIAGVGGFLGIGEKEVAVSMDQLSWTVDEDGDPVLVGTFTKEQLEAAPAFDRDTMTRNKTTAMEQPAGKTMPADEEVATAEKPMTAEPDTNDAMTTAATPSMEYVSTMDAKLEADEIIGMSVTGADNENIGEVSDILIDEGGKVEAFIIDVGGFLGINEKPIAVSFSDLQFARAEGSDDWTAIHTGLTAEALEGQTAYTEDQYKSDKDSVIILAPVN